MIGRVAALGALVLAVVVVAIVVLGSSSGYQVKAVFLDASQIVSGDQVEVAGNVVGTVSNIALTPSGQAALTLSINNSTYQPLHQGTHATIRLASLSGIANRYVDLDLGPATAPKIPSGGEIPTSQTTTTVDLDELFNSLNGPTRKGLQNVLQGSASQYAGRGQEAQLAWQYLNPSIAASSVLFHELNRDTSKFTRFVTTSSNLFTDLAERQTDLSGLISHLSTTFSALASQQVALGQSIQRLPPFMRLTNTTFVNLRNALGDLTSLINATKTIANPKPGYPRGKLYALLQQLKPLAIQSVPTIRNLANVISRRGPQNDLIDLNKLALPLAQVTCGNQPKGQPLQCNSNDTFFVDGAQRQGAFPVSANALQQSVPELAVARPYAVDLTGWFEGYSHPGLYDANGAVSRIAPVVGAGTVENGVLNLASPLLNDPGTREAFAQSVLTTGQGDRCPGSMERGPSGAGSSAASYQPTSRWYESGFPCNPSEVPTGP